MAAGEIETSNRTKDNFVIIGIDFGTTYTVVARSMYRPQQIPYTEGIEVIREWPSRINKLSDHWKIEKESLNLGTLHNFLDILEDISKRDSGIRGQESFWKWWRGQSRRKNNRGRKQHYYLELLNITFSICMGATFMWLNSKLRLEQSSAGIEWLIDRATDHIPPKILEALAQTPNSVIFSGFLIATTVFTGTTLIWMRDGSRGSLTKVMSTALACCLLIAWALAGVTAEELILVSLPLSMSLGMMGTMLFPSCKSRRVVCDCEILDCKA